jgi:hypothetical protein
MGYRDPIREAGPDARRDLLATAIVLGAHLDAPEGEVDDETLVRALSTFMDARACYLASLGARYGITLDSGPLKIVVSPVRVRVSPSKRRWKSALFVALGSSGEARARPKVAPECLMESLNSSELSPGRRG